jgi:hypothetical protein
MQHYDGMADDTREVGWPTLAFSVLRLVFWATVALTRFAIRVVWGVLWFVLGVAAGFLMVRR